MSEFDELLRDVLAAEVRVGPPHGMERRIRATLSEMPARASTMRRMPHEAIAAALLMGVAGMLVFRHHRTDVPASARTAAASMAKATAPADELAAAPVRTGAHTRVQRGASIQVARLASPSPRKVTGIAPLTVDSLVIAPIEIASLASDKQTGRATEWGER